MYKFPDKLSLNLNYGGRAFFISEEEHTKSGKESAEEVKCVQKMV